MIQSVELNDKYFCAFNDSKDKKIFKLSNTARKIFWVARIFDATVPNFTNGRAIAPLAPLSPTPMDVMIAPDFWLATWPSGTACGFNPTRRV